VPGGFTAVVADGSGSDVGTTAAEPADAYALALLARLTDGTAWTDTRSLPLGRSLSADAAVTLIRRMAIQN